MCVRENEMRRYLIMWHCINQPI